MPTEFWIVIPEDDVPDRHSTEERALDAAREDVGESQGRCRYVVFKAVALVEEQPRPIRVKRFLPDYSWPTSAAPEPLVSPPDGVTDPLSDDEVVF